MDKGAQVTAISESTLQTLGQLDVSMPDKKLCEPNVTGYWKTDHVRTFGQLLFIGPANSHTHTVPEHCCINGLS